MDPMYAVGMAQLNKMGQETAEENAQRPSRTPEQRQRRLLRVPATLMVKLGQTLENLGHAYLEDQPSCSS